MGAISHEPGKTWGGSGRRRKENNVKRYRVLLEQQVYLFAYVEVDAGSPEEANDAAEVLAITGEPTWETGDAVERVHAVAEATEEVA